MPCAMPAAAAVPGSSGTAETDPTPQLPFHASELLLWLQLLKEVSWSRPFSPVPSPGLLWLHLTEPRGSVKALHKVCFSSALVTEQNLGRFDKTNPCSFLTLEVPVPVPGFGVLTCPAQELACD